MALTAKKQPERTSADLAADIARIQYEISHFIEGRIAELKASHDGAGLPPESLRRMLVRGECPCRATTRLIEEANGQ